MLKRRFASMILVICILFLCMPTFSSAESVEKVSEKADSVWNRLIPSEKKLAAQYKDTGDYMDAVYELYRSQKDIKDIRRESTEKFSFRVGYIR